MESKSLNYGIDERKLRNINQNILEERKPYHQKLPIPNQTLRNWECMQNLSLLPVQTYTHLHY